MAQFFFGLFAMETWWFRNIFTT